MIFRLHVFGCLLCLSGAVSAEKVYIADFSSGDFEGWQEESFEGHTRYTFVDSDDGLALKAVSRAAASGLYREKRIDLTTTPWLNWEWKIEGTLGDIDERTRQGDDYAARVYVVFSGGMLFRRTRSVVYVWSSNQPVGSEWRNAYTGNARLIAVRSGDDEAGEWKLEKRNVRKDYKRLFGRDVTEADAVAIMTDTDDSGLEATAWYGNIWFSSE